MQVVGIGLLPGGENRAGHGVDGANPCQGDEPELWAGVVPVVQLLRGVVDDDGTADRQRRTDEQQWSQHLQQRVEVQQERILRRFYEFLVFHFEKLLFTLALP